jgi:His/Glu/Gln/Arg/opine family amino acid ABC transporter permease subunit
MLEIQPIIRSIPLLLQGLQVTLIACSFGSLLAVAVGVVLGTAYLLQNPLTMILVRSYVYFFRGTPQLVLLFLAYFGLPVIGIQLPALVAGIIAIGLCSGAYIAEAVRSALESVDQAQREAASLEGAYQWQILAFVVFPQALRQMIAPTTNELINLVKGSSLLAVISVGDVTRAAQLVVGREFVPFEMYLTLAFIYLAINSILTRASHLLERHTEI